MEERRPDKAEAAGSNPARDTYDAAGVQDLVGPVALRLLGTGWRV